MTSGGFKEKIHALGLCFPSPIPESSGQAFHDFLSAKPGDIHNPWPELVPLDAREQGWSFPPIYGWYAPATRPIPLFPPMVLPPAKPTPDLGEEDFWLPIRAARLHEQLHLSLNLTPAK